MLLQCRILVLNDAKASHNEVHVFGSELCRLFQSALHAVFYNVFLTVFFQWCQCVVDFLIWACQLVPPLFSPTPLHSAPCSRDYRQHYVRDGSNKALFFLFLFFSPSGEWRTVNFVKLSSRGKHQTEVECILFIYLHPQWAHELNYWLNCCTLLCRVEEWEAQAVTFYQWPVFILSQ